MIDVETVALDLEMSNLTGGSQDRLSLFRLSMYFLVVEQNCEDGSPRKPPFIFFA
jgi:hypothetical protein